MSENLSNVCRDSLENERLKILKIVLKLKVLLHISNIKSNKIITTGVRRRHLIN